MAMTAQSMAAKIKAARVTLAQTTNAETAASNADAALLAFCQGIIDEIAANSQLVATATDSHGGISAGSVK
jgi:hypothetical protein